MARQMDNPYKASTVPAEEAPSSSSSAMVYEVRQPTVAPAYLSGVSSHFLAQLGKVAIAEGVDQEEFIRVVHETTLKTKDVDNPLTARRCIQTTAYYTSILHYVYNIPLDDI